MEFSEVCVAYNSFPTTVCVTQRGANSESGPENWRMCSVKGDQPKNGPRFRALWRKFWGLIPLLPAARSPWRQPVFGLFRGDRGLCHFPHKGRHAFSVASGTVKKAGAWRWICEQFPTGVKNPVWFHWDSVGAAGAISPNFFIELVIVGCPPLWNVANCAIS